MNTTLKKFLLIGALVVGLAALSIIGKGLLYPSNVQAEDISTLSGNVQQIESVLTSSGYPDLIVQKGVPVRWNLKVGENTLNSCNNALVIPEYGLEVQLQPGDNIIEFTPDKSGLVPYSCWMGMIDGNISVVDDINNPDLAALKSKPVLAGPAGSGGIGGCCNLRSN